MNWLFIRFITNLLLFISFECSLCSLAISLTNKINLLKYILELETVIKIIFKCWKMELEEPGGHDEIGFLFFESLDSVQI